MSRPLRLEFPGAWWHVTNRGVEQRDIFLDDRDRRTFVRILAEAVPRFRWCVHAFVLMTNHFHLLIETGNPTLSRGMQKVEGDYAEYFNWRYRRVGHLFQGRFKGHLVDSERYLLEVARYIVLNPVRAKMVAEAGDWPWSSYRTTSGLAKGPAWLTTAAILHRFDPKDSKSAMTLYREFVNRTGEVKSPWDQLVGQIYLGSREFIARVQQRIDEHPRSTEHPRSQRVVRFVELEQITEAVLQLTGARQVRSSGRRVRLLFAALARCEALASLSAIGSALGVGISGASYLVKRAEELKQADASFAALFGQAQLRIRNWKL